MNAALLISHGSHSPKTKKEVVSLVKHLKSESAFKIFKYAFLEIEKPNIPDGIAQCIEKGATHITLLLNFLNSGRHVDEDIPEIIRKTRTKYPHVHFQISQPIGQHPKIKGLFLDFLKENR